jgi:hypothetical protein
VDQNKVIGELKMNTLLHSTDLASPRRTKIVGTLGPGTDSPERALALIKAGLDVARVNFSHGGAGEVINAQKRSGKQQNSLIVKLRFWLICKAQNSESPALKRARSYSKRVLDLLLIPVMESRMVILNEWASPIKTSQRM